uniref:Uncharacterized protein n=1 Tax=Caenorhabditis tropicalis TaxID=1561998 RepID=A0A1I7UUV0_9PELO
MKSASTLASKLTTTPEFEEEEDHLTPAYVYIIIEFVYLLGFAVSAYLLRKYSFMKTDDDAVTKHHRRHYEMMKKQQEELIKKQNEHENFSFADKIEK